VTVLILATMLMMIVAAGLTSLGLDTWAAPTSRHLAFVGIAGLCVALGHSGLLLAYWLGRTSTVAPLFYGLAFWGRVSPCLGRVAEPSGPLGHCPDRRKRHWHCPAQPREIRCVDFDSVEVLQVMPEPDVLRFTFIERQPLCARSGLSANRRNCRHTRVTTQRCRCAR
jgi:hypothetical protein